jgi:hypothetical protein
MAKITGQLCSRSLRLTMARKWELGTRVRSPRLIAAGPIAETHSETGYGFGHTNASCSVGCTTR